MNTTTAIVHDHQHRAKDGKEAMLEIRITNNRRHVFFSTGIKVRRSEWVAGKIVNRLDADILNERLAIIYKKVGEEVNLAMQQHSTINVSTLRARIFTMREDYAASTAHPSSIPDTASVKTAPVPNGPSSCHVSYKDNSIATHAQSGPSPLLEWIAVQIPLLDIDDGTRKHYVTLQNRLDEYGHLRYWRDVTTESIYQFDAWLHTLRKPVSDAALKAGVKPKRLSDGGIYNYHKCLKALLNRAARFGKIDRNPYELLKGQFKRGDRENPEYLTEDEMTRIRNLQLPLGSVLDIARDLFIFQLYTGLAYSDAQAFNFSRYRQVDGIYRYTGHRIKTGVPYISELLPPAIAVLKKYGGTVPKIGNADYNHRLKEIQRMAHIDTRLHSHLARHSFATWMLANGAKIENVSRMLGHTNITQTQRYAKVLAPSVHDDYDRARQKLTPK